MSALTKAYQRELKRTREAVSDHVTKTWNALPDYRDENVPAFLDKVLPVVQAGQARAVALTNAYVSRKMGIAPLALDIAKLTGAAARNGVLPEEVYKRGFTTLWTSIATIGFDAAKAKALSRLTSASEMDVAMASRNTLVAYGETEERITGWTRVADPGCCDYCQMINGAKTGPTEPQPLHNRCGCTAEPTYGTFAKANPDETLAPGDTYDEVAIEEHGELGPMITNRHDNFTGPSDLSN